MKFRIPLKGYLSLHFGVVAVLPVITIACLVWFFMVPAIKTRTGTQHQAMARSIAGQISAYLTGGARQLTVLAGYLQNRGLQPDPETAGLLDAQCGKGEFFEAVFVVNRADLTIQAVGLAQSRRRKRADFMGLDFSGHKFIHRVKRLNQPAWSKTFLSTVSSRMAVALTVPLEENVIAGEITLDQLSAFVSLLPVESESLILVIDDQGRIVADSQKRRSGQVLNINCPGAKGPEGGNHADSTAFELDGQKMLGVVVEMDTVGWKVLVAQSARKAFQPLRETFAMIGLGLATALGLALTIAWLLAGNLTVLFRSYAERAESIADGRYHLQWPAANTREFFKLGLSLQRMAEKISQREKALVDSEERIKDFIANVPGVVYQYKADPNALESSSLTSVVRERTIEIFGLDSEQKTFFNDFVRCLPEDDQPRFIMSVKESLQTVSPWYYEGRFTKPPGEEIWFEGRAAPRRVGGEMIYYGVFTDITRRKEMEARLRLSKFIIDKAPIGIWKMGGNGAVLDVNEQGCASLGYTREELCRMTVFDFAPGFGIDDWRDGTTRLDEAGTRTIEALHQRKNGGIFPIQVIENLMQFENQAFHVAFVQDITERKKNEEKLRRLRNYLSNIIDSMPSILVAVDRKGKVTQWNHRTVQATGLSFEKARSQPLAEVFPLLTNEMARIETAIREGRVIHSAKVSREVEQETRYENITIFPLVAEGGEGAVIRVDDVTKQVRLEEMMIQSEKMLSVGGLAAGMAHEINNPLAGILQSASVLENRLLGDLPANHKAAEAAGTTLAAIRQYFALRKLPDMVGNIQELGARAAGIVRNMLSFVRKSDRVVSNHDLGFLLDQTIELVKTDYDMKKHYDFKQVHIVREYDPAAPPVPCEASKLQQVFINILKNGAEAMAEQTSASAPPRFVLRVRDDGNWLRVEIEDNGPGMDEHTRRRIFEPFFTTKPVGRGTGLGLSVSYFIITEDHGGEMSVRAADGGGTCFLIRLPKTDRI